MCLVYKSSVVIFIKGEFKFWVKKDSIKKVYGILFRNMWFKIIDDVVFDFINIMSF